MPVPNLKRISRDPARHRPSHRVASAGGDRYARLLFRLAQSIELPSTTIVNVEEQMRGWLAAISKEKRIERQVRAYHEFGELFDRFSAFTIAKFDDAAVAIYASLRPGRGHLGTRDMKIAAISISQSALLLTANRHDFEQIPQLRFENWMDA